MQFFLFLVLFYGVLMLGLVGLGLGAGLLLHWLMPWLDKSLGMLIGVLATGFSAYFMLHIITAVGSFADEEGEQWTEEKHPIIFKTVPRSRRRRRRPE